MRNTTANDLETRAITAAQVGSLVVALTGLPILAGWFLHLPELTYLYLPGPNVKTNAAIGLVTGGLASLLLVSAAGRRPWTRAGRVLAMVPLLLGGLTLSEHLVGWNLGIDELLATEPPGAFGTASPNRMGPPASTTFLLLGLAMLLVDGHSGRARRAGRGLATVAAMIPVLPLLGYAYGFSEFYGIARYTGIALSTAVALQLLGLSVLAGRPEGGLAALLCRPDEVGTAARRLLPAAILLPFVLGWLLVRLMGGDVIDGPFAISAMALVLIGSLTGLIWHTEVQLAGAVGARLRVERALSETAQSLREADRQKDDFLATLSHELRNPLAPIRFAAELLDQPPPASERARHTIRRQVEHLARLIDDLLDLTRITSNKLELQRRPVLLGELVNDALDAAAAEIARGGQQVQVQLPERPVWLYADPDRVVQIVVNLLNNAVRHTGPGGIIVVRGSIEEEQVTIEVRDNGRGIAPEDLGRVFDRFVQIGGTRHGGLGIGLTIVKGLAELHGGSVEAHSAGPGRGSAFRVRLPGAETPETAGPFREPTGRGGRQLILVVDDNQDAADMLRDVLMAGGHEVLVAYDAAEALRLARSSRPGVGLVDIGMPGMNGYELAAELRRDHETAGMVLVAITGWGQQADRRRSVAAGFDAHLTKPADPGRILELIAERTAAPGPAERPPPAPPSGVATDPIRPVGQPEEP